MKALLNLFVQSAANDQATYSEWNNTSVVHRTATSEQSWRRKEPTPRRKQSTQAKQLTARNKNALARVTLQENKITPNRTRWKRCGNAVTTRSRPTTPLSISYPFLNLLYWHTVSLAWRSGREAAIRSEGLGIGSQLWACNGWTPDLVTPWQPHSRKFTNLTTYGYVLWCSQIVCTRHYSLNTIIAFYSVIEWSNVAVSVWPMACQATTLSHFT